MRPDGRPSAVAVDSVIAFGSIRSAVRASVNQRRNCSIGFESQCASSSAPRLYSNRSPSSARPKQSPFEDCPIDSVWHWTSWYTQTGMVYVLTSLHVLICLFLIIVVLLQSGKAADLAGAFGGMGSQTVFGPRGTATVLSKATTIAAFLFMVTSLTLAVMADRSAPSTGSVFENRKAPATQKAPAAPPAKTNTKK
jgi:preprotein translocase subunit SecG